MTSGATMKIPQICERPNNGRLARLRRNPHSSAKRHLLCGLFAALVLLSQPAITGADNGDGLPKVLRVGLLTRILVDIDVHEAQVAIELWAREMSRTMGMKSSAKVMIFPDSQAMCRAFRDGTLDIITLPCVEYIKIRDKSLVEPIFVAANSVGKGRDHLLIAHRDSGIRSIPDLRGKTMVLLPFARQEASHIWLDVLLMKEGKRNRADYFRQVREYSTASQAIMAVFFRQADAAIVNRGAFETAVALNPQIGRKTRVIAESASLAGEVTCVPAMADERMKRSITSAAMQMTKSAVGRQMSILFQVDRLIPYQPSYLDGLAELLKEQANLRGKFYRRR
jgi:ABC-type phosphate/phosphonate transport system substrate-binding protein